MEKKMTIAQAKRLLEEDPTPELLETFRKDGRKGIQKLLLSYDKRIQKNYKSRPSLKTDSNLSMLIGILALKTSAESMKSVADHWQGPLSLVRNFAARF